VLHIELLSRAIGAPGGQLVRQHLHGAQKTLHVLHIARVARPRAICTWVPSKGARTLIVLEGRERAEVQEGGAFTAAQSFLFIFRF